MPEAAPPARPVIALDIENAANARLLDSVIGGDHQLQHDLESAKGTEPDLVIVDRPSLKHHEQLIRDLCNRDAPRILPVLLISETRYDRKGRADPELGTIANDILQIPTSRVELLARVSNLLHLRQLSCAQESDRRELADVVGALQILNACDAVLVRAENEDALLESVCNSITQAKSYDLAWIGLVPSFSDTPEKMSPTILAKSGDTRNTAEDLTTEWPITADADALVTQALTSGEAQAHHAASPKPEATLPSTIAIPLEVSTGESGYLAIASSNPNQFDPSECQLLQRLGTNLGYALNSHRLQSERDRQSAEINKLAFSDSLTGLPNRRYLTNFLDDRLNQPETHRAAEAAVLFIDLDGFKIINDALGHEAGDEVLVQVSERLKGAVRDSDLVIRQGGDEFLVVMFDAPRSSHPFKNTDPERFIELAKGLANRIISNLQSPIALGDEAHHLSASIGISLCPDHGQSATTIIQTADIAMYEAKKQGGVCCVYTPQISEQRQQRLSLEGHLRHAIDHDELVLHFQPVFNMQTRAVTGTEALVRWPREDGTMVLPGTFIPLAEETGLIRPMGDWVLATSAQQLQVWHEAGYPLTMSVNISLRQLQSEEDVDRLAELVRPYIDPRWITLELTESMLITDPEAIEALMRRLNGHGFEIAIDDFGTGYSSLSRLQHMPIQHLKIDRRFVDQINQPGNGAAMIPIIQQMAASFHLSTVAEGIEDEDQYHHLCLQGASFGQGYWFGHPVPEAQLRKTFLEAASTH